MTLELIIQDNVLTEHTPTAAQFKLWLDTALSHIPNAPNAGEITVCILSIDESARLNETYRQKTGPTNVLSFSYDESDFFTGDLAVCADLVKQEALEQNKAITAHWAHLMIHGVLHLMGHDHIDPNEADTMESLERTILAELDYPDPY